jgi:hypothetical protein
MSGESSVPKTGYTNKASRRCPQHSPGIFKSPLAEGAVPKPIGTLGRVEPMLEMIERLFQLIAPSKPYV